MSSAVPKNDHVDHSSEKPKLKRQSYSFNEGLGGIPGVLDVDDLPPPPPEFYPDEIRLDETLDPSTEYESPYLETRRQINKRMSVYRKG